MKRAAFLDSGTLSVPGTLVPVQTIVLEGQDEYAMFRDLRTRYHWVLEPCKYESPDLLLAQLNEKVIAPAEAKAKELIRTWIRSFFFAFFSPHSHFLTVK